MDYKKVDKSVESMGPMKVVPLVSLKVASLEFQSVAYSAVQ